jgi:hypothetical protein
MRSKQGKKPSHQFSGTINKATRTIFCVSNVGSTEETPLARDILSLRIIYSELYDITCLINDTYGFPLLALTCWTLTAIIFFVYQALFYFENEGIINMGYAVICFVFFFRVAHSCQAATSEVSGSGTLVQKIILETNLKHECMKEWKMFSVQLEVMKVEYTACGCFSLNLRLLCSLIGAIVSYIIIMIQVK